MRWRRRKGQEEACWKGEKAEMPERGNVDVSGLPTPCPDSACSEESRDSFLFPTQAQATAAAGSEDEPSEPPAPRSETTNRLRWSRMSCSTSSERSRPIIAA